MTALDRGLLHWPFTRTISSSIGSRTAVQNRFDVQAEFGRADPHGLLLDQSVRRRRQTPRPRHPSDLIVSAAKFR